MSARPSIHTRAHAEAYPERVAVIRDSETGEWLVWRGENLTTVRDTHAEAITAAQRIAREGAGRVWTTPDSGTQADYSLATH